MVRKISAFTAGLSLCWVGLFWHTMSHKFSGPQAFVYGIQFNGTTDTRKIREYLISEGYEQQKHCQTEAACWRSPRSKDVVSFYSLSKLDLVSVEIYRRKHAD